MAVKPACVKRTDLPWRQFSIISCLEHDLFIANDLLHSILVLFSADTVSLRYMQLGHIRILTATRLFQDVITTFTESLNTAIISACNRINATITLMQLEQFLSNLPQTTTKWELKKNMRIIYIVHIAQKFANLNARLHVSSVVSFNLGFTV